MVEEPVWLANEGKRRVRSAKSLKKLSADQYLVYLDLPNCRARRKTTDRKLAGGANAASSESRFGQY